MAVALPFVGAAVGWLGGGAAWAQVGWMVGSMIYSAVQPKPTMSAGNPSTAPSVGSDIRGQNIPVVFGTVRASGYLIWQRNFKSTKNTKKVGSGKKKTKQEYYSYSWDFLFHMGMATEPYRIIGIWEGSERLQDESLDNITFADASTFLPAVKVEQSEALLKIRGRDFWNEAVGENRFRQLQAVQAGKSAQWSEAYFYGAHATSDAENGWSYFQTQESAPNVRWPSSIWIGFKQLQLGEQPRIPQYNFEITPDTDASMSTAYNGTVSSPEITTGSATDRQHSPVGVTVGGNQALFTTSDGDTLVYAMNTRTGVEVSLDKTTAVAAQLANGNPHTARMNDLEWRGAVMLPGTNDFILWYSGLEPAGPSNQQFNMACFFELSEDGTFTSLGYSYWDFNLPVQYLTSAYTACLDDTQANVYIFGHISNSQDACIVKFPYVRTNGSTEDQGTISNVSATLDDHFLIESYTYQDRNANMNTNGFLVPMASGNIRFYWFMSKARVNYTTDNVTLDGVTETQAAAYPNGGMFYVEFNTSGTVVTGVTSANASFDTNGPPFDDDGKNEDGSTITTTLGNGYTELFYCGPANIGRSASNWIVGFQRDVSQGSSNSSTGSFASFRTFEFNVTTGAFAQIGSEVSYSMEDVVQKYDVSSGGRYTDLTYVQINTMYAPISGELLRVAQYRDNARAFDIVVRVGRVRAGIVDYTPPEIIRAIFTNAAVGFGKSTSLIDTTTYDAAVQYCIENGILISVVYPAAAERVTIFEALANVYGGWVAWTGTKLKFGKPTETFVAAAVIDNDCYVQENPDDPKPPLNAKRQALQDTCNKITVKYYDRSMSYRQNAITIGDEVDQDLNGVRHKQLDTGMIMSKQTAYRLAERMLWGNMYARNIYSDVMVGWKRARVEPGDAITLVDSFSNTNVSARVVKREEVERGKIKLTLVEELDYLGKTKVITEDPLPGVRGLPTTTERALDFDAYELPYEFQKFGPRYYVGYAPGGPTAAAGLYTSPSTTEFRLYGSVLPYPDGGRVLSYFPPTEDIMTNVRVVVNAKSGTNVSSISTWFEGEIEDFNSFDRAQGLSTFRVGSELMAYEGATLVGSNVYQLDKVYRGWGGTQVAAHSGGDTWWLHDPADGGGIFAIPYASDQIGNTFYYKVVPVGFDGVEYDPTSVPYKAYTIGGDHFTPRPVASSDVRILVGSDTTIPASLANIYGPLAGTSLDYINPYFVRRVGSSDERNIMAHWPETSRDTGYGAQGYGVPTYGSFTQDLDTVSWLFSVIGSGNAVVRSVSVTTPGYAYDATMNVADNGAWRGNVAFTVRPKNAYGLSPYAAVVSLQIDGT